MTDLSDKACQSATADEVCSIFEGPPVLVVPICSSSMGRNPQVECQPVFVDRRC